MNMSRPGQAGLAALSIAVVAAVSAAAVAQAHVITYVGSPSPSLLACAPDGSVCIGGAIFAAGHLPVAPYPPGACGASPCPPGRGTNTITVTDAVHAAVAGGWCQDKNRDNICSVGLEPMKTFCGYVKIETGTGSTIPSDKWDPELESWLFLTTPSNGNALIGTSCGLITAFGVAGTIEHTP